jgi:hypothetical protein
MERRPNNRTLHDAASRSLGERLDQASGGASNPMEGKLGVGKERLRGSSRSKIVKKMAPQNHQEKDVMRSVDSFCL